MKYSYLLVSFFVIITINSCKSEEPIVIEDHELKTVQAKNIVEKNNQFAFDFFKEVSIDETRDNFMVSPVSLSLALGMTYNGTDGETKEAFNQVLNYTTPLIEVNQFNKDLIGKLSSSADGSVMEIANSIWINQLLKVKDEFVNLNKDFYAARVQNLDFEDQASVGIINRWVSNKTHNKITSIIDVINKSDAMFLINAIYFNANWKYKFDTRETRNSSFYKNETETVQVDMMTMTENIQYFHNDLFSSIILPYKQDKFSMIIILPNENMSTPDVIAEMNGENWRSWLENHSASKIKLSIPRFKLAYKNLLNDELIHMGLGIAFSDEANFNKISDRHLNISEVLQKTFIDVNEKGTEAAAVTVVTLETTSIGPQSKYFNANKPFLYIIQENISGSICFIGRVGEPKYEE